MPDLATNTDPLGLAAGRFANIVNVGHGVEFFVVDFRSLAPDGESPLVGRFFITPGHMKRLRAAIDSDLGEYERQFGEVDAHPLGTGASVGN
jgi:hypothetical protein